MKEFIKDKFFTILTVGVTIILAGVAVFTAVRLYQLRQESITPTQPENELEAYTQEPQTTSCASLAFTLTQPPVSCNESCTSDSDCEGDLICSSNLCRNSSCTSETDCVCPNSLSNCNESCSADSDCEGDLICSSGYCRNSSCTEETDCTCSTSLSDCNESCTTDSDCEGDLICSSNLCRNSSCTSEEDCSCPETNPTNSPTPTDSPIGGNEPTATPTNTPDSTSTPTPTTKLAGNVSPDSSGQALPDAGISTPTVFGIFLGFLLIIASILLAV